MAQPALNEQSADDSDDKTARIFIAVTPAMLSDVEDFRFSNRFKSQSGAVRKLIELGLAAATWQARGRKAQP